ncbi:MAG: contractile injection system tape measure protein [bacterium]|nr:contractile injection system tape measure protein [bacterium]
MVDKHIFDIHYDSEATAIAMQRKISTISNEKLFALIDTIFDEFDTNETIRIHSLELDLGRIREANLEEDLLDAVSLALRKQLDIKIQVAKTNSQEATNNPARERNVLAIFEQFIASGTVPWWIRNRNDFDIRKTIIEVLESHREHVGKIIKKRANRPYFLERLVLNLNDEQLILLTQELAPAEAKQVIEAAKNIQTVQERRSIVPSERRTYRNKVWEFVLTYLLIDRGTAFNQKMFVQATLARLAHHFNMEYSAFLSLFYDAVKEMDQERIVPKGLVGIIKEIYSERDVPTDSKEIKDTQIDAEITAVYTQLLNTSVNFDGNFESQILQLIRTNSEVFLSFIKRESGNKQLQNNLVKVLSDTSMYEFVGFIEPQSKEVVEQFSKNVQGLKANSRVSISGSSQEFRDVTWKFILEALLEDHGSQFNLKSFVKVALSNIARHFNMVLHDLMHFVLLDLNTYHTVDKSSLEAVLLEIKSEEEQKIQEDSSIEEAVFRRKVKFHWLEYALTHSEFPVWSKRHHLSEEMFPSILSELIQEDAATLKNLLRAQLRENRKRHFLIRRLDHQGRLQLVRLLNARAANKIALYDQLLNKVQERRSVASNKQEFESIKWSTILEILTEEKGSFFNYKTFVLRSLYELSNRLNIAFEVLFSYVQEVSSTLPNMPESPLQNALLSIQEDLHKQVDNWSAENVKLENDWQRIWESIKGEVPEETIVLMALLQKMESNTVFRSQFDLHAWLRKHPKINRKIFGTILLKLHWSETKFAQLLSGQRSSSEQALLHWFVGGDYPFLAYYMKDLEKIFAFTSFDNGALLRQSELFSAAYVAKYASFDKHQYFFALVRFLGGFLGEKSNNLVLKLQQIIKQEAPDLNSTLALSVSKAVHGESLTSEANQEERKVEEQAVEEMEETDIEEQEEVENTEDLDSVYIENAGIIIMWPFLRQFFEVLELTKDNSFVSIAASIRGVQLLQYMCTGETSHPEHELILNKLLCGIPVNIPIDNSFELSPKERETADSMVKGVLANWSGMEETSVEALRETFFIRAAKISFEDETNDMHVEKKAVDILLDRLPWSFTFVNLPWMKKPLRTIWK